MIRTVARAALLLACAGATAQAQLGGLIKKAKEKVENKADEATGDKTPAKKLAGDPVDAPTLDAVLRGLALEVQNQDQSAQLRKARSAKYEERQAAEKAAGTEIENYRKTSSVTDECIHGSIGDSNKSHEGVLQQKMTNIASDPKGMDFVKKYTDLSQQLGAAQMKKDTATSTRVLAQMMGLLGLDPARDSAVAFAKCGKAPAKPASLVRAEALRKDEQALDDQVRGIEGGTVERAAAASGLPAATYALARERLLTWNLETKDKKKQVSVTKDEDALFRSRAADIGKVSSALK